jgi:adenylosuccinate synthase
MNSAVLGQIFGDEAKGAITHALSPKYNWVIRSQGGNNAGHTIYRDGKKYLHNLLPSVDYRHPTIKSYLGAGMVLDVECLLSEVKEAEKSFPGVAKSIFVDKDAHIVLTSHKEEDKLLNAHIGTTGRGIGGAYKAKVGRTGVRVRDLLKDNNQCLQELKNLGVNFVCSLELFPEFEKSRLLFEGAQGVLLDINHGIYPYVTSSDCTVSGIAAAGFSKFMPSEVFGIGKVYLTKVGEGPMPTEVFGEEAEKLRSLGHEYGSNTGRPRRIGYLDLPAMRYAIAKSGINKLVLSKFDILDGLGEIKVCVRYEAGEPMSSSDFFDAVPVYKSLPGWKDSHDLSQIKHFVDFISNETGLKVSYISCGIKEGDIMNPYTGEKI